MQKLIYDIGMHTGEDTKYYLKQGYNVIAVDANPDLVKEAEKKFSKYISSGQLTILNIGIADTDKVLPFYKNLRKSQWSSFDKDIGTRAGTPYEVIEIKCSLMENVFKQYGVPYYMKVDIEGNDFLCLLGISDNAKPKYISCEACKLEWLDIMANKGYSKFKMISQLDNYTPINLKKERKSYYPPYKIIENGIKLRVQKVIPFKHLYGSSGPFGEQTKGNWKSYEEIKRAFLEFNSDNESGKPLNNVSWFDFHATY
ncbi:MAG: FkbM family methyltransferase [Chitinophagaceae bacterium]|jgi:FkbM family methyltransferase|nr:FkbM family methyltransferase [Chitinophagaceae bacterium]